MRRLIEVFLENVNTSFYLLKSLFSSLPLPGGALFEKTSPPGPPRKNF